MATAGTDPATGRTPKPVLVARGIVLLATGSPAPDVAVGIDGSVAPPVRSDREGRFEIPLASEGAKVVSRDPAYVTVLQGTCSASQSVETVLVVARPIEIEGQVVSSSGRAIAGVDVVTDLPEGFEKRLTYVLDRSRRINWRSKSGADGRFVTKGLPAIDGLQLTATRAPFHPKQQSLTGRTDRRVYVVMREVGAEEGPAIVGRVIYP